MATTLIATWGAWAIDPLLNNVTVTGGATAAGTPILLGAANANTSGVELALAVSYAAAPGGVPPTLYLCRDADGTNYESPTTGAPYGRAGATPVASSTASIFALASARTFAKFLPTVSQPSGASITVTLRYRFLTLTQG